MAQLPKTVDLQQLISKWSSQLNPLLANPLLQGGQISNVVLVASTPQTINHLLGKMQTGWIITDQNAAAEVYRTQPFNDLTLTLEASANCTVSLWVY
jgi:hypothetical protein